MCLSETGRRASRKKDEGQDLISLSRVLSVLWWLSCDFAPALPPLLITIPGPELCAIRGPLSINCLLSHLFTIKAIHEIQMGLGLLKWPECPCHKYKASSEAEIRILCNSCLIVFGTNVRV